MDTSWGGGFGYERENKHEQLICDQLKVAETRTGCKFYMYVFSQINYLWHRKIHVQI